MLWPQQTTSKIRMLLIAEISKDRPNQILVLTSQLNKLTMGHFDYWPIRVDVPRCNLLKR